MKQFVFLMLMFTLGCQNGRNTATGVATAGEFRMRVGQSIAIDGDALTITFIEVTEDSRCPSNVVCVWAGNAAIRLNVMARNSEASSTELNTNLDPGSVDYGAFTIELVALVPSPHTERTISPDEYVATLLVSER